MPKTCCMTLIEWFAEQQPLPIDSRVGCNGCLSERRPAGLRQGRGSPHAGDSRPTRQQRGDTFLNVLQNPNVAIVFIVPKRREVGRVSGAARIVTDGDLLDTMAVQGTWPDLALLIRVKEAFLHCGKSMIRSEVHRLY
jgi:hypothetical protein